jgi:hypothetical protein
MSIRTTFTLAANTPAEVRDAILEEIEKRIGEAQNQIAALESLAAMLTELEIVPKKETGQDH